MTSAVVLVTQGSETDATLGEAPLSSAAVGLVGLLSALIHNLRVLLGIGDPGVSQ